MKDYFKSGHFWCRFVPLLWCVFNITVLAGIVLGNCARAATIIGDSHVGGLKPYLIRHMQVKYRNGSSADYWLKHPVHDSTLIVMTGTNDRIAGKSSAQWLKQTEATLEEERADREKEESGG